MTRFVAWLVAWLTEPSPHPRCINCGARDRRPSGACTFCGRFPDSL